MTATRCLAAILAADDALVFLDAVPENEMELNRTGFPGGSDP